MTDPSILAPRIAFDAGKLDALFAVLDQAALPGAAVGVALDGAPVYRRGVGLANMELPVRLTPDMRLRIGSTSKQFTALAFMLLCEDGLAAIDQPVGQVLPGLAPAAARATARQLMTHTSGLPDALEIAQVFSGSGHAVPTSALTALYRTLPAASEPPGERWRYNNGAYALLCEVIESIAGQPLETVLHDRILAPTGMGATFLRRYDTDFVANSATLHMTEPGGGFVKAYLGTSSAGMGGIVSTVDDMLTWLAHMDAPAVGGAATWAAMKTPQRLGDGAATRYGLGLILDSYRGIPTLSHAGGVMGGNAQALKLPDFGLDVVVLVNRHDVSAPDLAFKVVDALVEGLDPPPGPGGPRLRAGLYVGERSGRLVQIQDHDGAQLISIDGMELSFVAEGSGGHVPAPGKSYFDYRLRQVGEEIRFDDFGVSERCLRLEDQPRLPARMAGSYRSEMGKITLSVEPRGDLFALTAHGPFGVADLLFAPLAGLWGAVRNRWGPVGVARFDPEGSRLVFQSPRIPPMSFERRQA